MQTEGRYSVRLVHYGLVTLALSADTTPASLYGLATLALSADTTAASLFDPATLALSADTTPASFSVHDQGANCLMMLA